jgi:membrane-bound lytic murein transglycosylase F
MKKQYGHVGGIFLAVIIGFSGCQNNPVPPDRAVTEQDSLMFMIERQIEEKMQQKAQVEEFRRKQLPRNFAEQIKKYFPIIRKYSKWYGLDWRLIIAQILKESFFKENALSNMGAMGLMQIMPKTAREITSELDIAYISKDPRENITAGIYHMYKLLQLFPDADPENRLKLALAAYNAGPARVYDAQDIARFKGLDPNSWEAVKECLPLLTADQWNLHLEVWEQGVPSFGYFYGYDQTIDYVDDIMVKYDILKHMYKMDVDPVALDDLTATF